MRAMLLIFLLSHQLFLYSHEYEKPKKSIQVYLCSRLTQSAREWNDVILREFNEDADFSIFRPQDLDVKNLKGFELDYVAYNGDLNGIIHSDLLLVLPPYGRDCAWEIGWFCGANKLTIAYSESEGDWVHDSMVLGGLNAIITNNATLYETFLDNPLTSQKCYFIHSKSDLASCIKKIYKQFISKS
jgi:nucleoside 2-deoxyribosyltransferase